MKQFSFLTMAKTFHLVFVLLTLAFFIATERCHSFWVKGLFQFQTISNFLRNQGNRSFGDRSFVATRPFQLFKLFQNLKIPNSASLSHLDLYMAEKASRTSFLYHLDSKLVFDWNQTTSFLSYALLAFESQQKIFWVDKQILFGSRNKNQFEKTHVKWSHFKPPNWNSHQIF